ncbi:hypothetical protein N0V82_008032 [Gnomoniopsis sp. IMI 355080]|nr:hypothetical protein N0V82_008032 [Gnomoniopsis sp. IMI 355080]
MQSIMSGMAGLLDAHGPTAGIPASEHDNSNNSNCIDAAVSPSLLPSATISAQTSQQPDSREAVALLAHAPGADPGTGTGAAPAPAPANESAIILNPSNDDSDLAWLGPLIDDGTGIASAPSSDTNHSPKISAQTSRHTQIQNNNHSHNVDTTGSDTTRPQPPPPQQQQQSNDDIAVPPELVAKKLSPGLAARLKALGLGSLKKPTQPPTGNEQVGRLAEEQIRQIDGFWTDQQRSAKFVIQRRGRPWKGVVRIPSRTSLKSAKSNKDVVTPEDVDIPTIQILESPDNNNSADPLHIEFEASEALDMDTNKYRLPDHTNGNGTKVTLDTRREHLGRDLRRPPSPPDEPPPPPVPAKDTPPLSNQSFNPDDYFNPLGLQRPGSIYTISRASFANQLAQLTSLQLPDAESLAAKVAAIPSAQAAVKALIGAADQIRSWISKASEVIAGLDSDDDVEWSAAGGREGLEEVESATSRFEGLINVYVTAIEELQERGDIANVSTDDLTKAVTQMEAIMEEWTNIRMTLRSVRGQVEIAMEWEELWNVVLAEIQSELEELSRLVFEMEERRHKSAIAIASGDAVDIGDLQTIVEETPPTVTRAQANGRFSVPGLPVSPGSPSPGAPAISADDSSLLALFARMQPLRASLDFLPMRLSTFEARSQSSFPTACDELEMRREGLESTYKKLEKDAEGLRKELGEDRWVLVFRGAARQAQKMTESVDRSVERLREAVDAGMHLTNLPAFLKKIESYDAKKTHYGPAIDRVLLIIERGVKERLTVNGEILRLSTDLQAKWADLKRQIKEMDMILDEVQADKKGTHLRDSISSMLSNEMASTVASGLETPQSSPPSSVIMSGLGIETRTPGSKSGSTTRARRSSSGVSNHMPPMGRRSVSATTPSIPRKPVSRLSTFGGHSTPSREGSATPTSRLGGNIPRPSTTMAHRPRWNSSTNTSNIDTGHNFKPLTLTTPSPFAKNKATATPVRSHSSLAAPIGSRLPTRSPLRAASPSPSPQTPPRPVSKLNLLQGPPLSRGRNALLPSNGNELGMAPRPASSLATTNRRSSMLPVPKFMRERSQTGNGRASPMPGSTSRLGMKRGNSVSSKDKPTEKPRWVG